MTFFASIVATDPVDDVHALRLAATRAVGGDDTTPWSEHDFGEVHMLQNRADQGLDALVSVHFQPDGKALDEEEDTPHGYVRVLLNFGEETDDGDCYRRQQTYGRKIGEWLKTRGVSAMWQYEESEWIRL